jgi:hypothetical protein
MMAITIAIVLAFLSLAFVLYPLLYRQSSTTTSEQKTQKTRSTGEDIEVQTLEESEQTARGAIQEVELDYQLGNIEERDYRSLRERYMRRAMSALKSQYEHEQKLDRKIEEQLRILKESHEKTNN